MNGCAVVNIPGLTGSSSGSLTAGSATSVANRDPSGDHTGSPAARLNDSRHGFASPLRSMGTDIRRLFFQNSNDLPSGDQEMRPRPASRGGSGTAPTPPIAA